LGLKECAK